MTTDIRAVRDSSRAGKRASNFHEQAALESYGQRFNQIGIASVAAAAAQVKPTARREGAAFALPTLLREEQDAA